MGRHAVAPWYVKVATPPVQLSPATPIPQPLLTGTGTVVVCLGEVKQYHCTRSRHVCQWYPIGPELVCRPMPVQVETKARGGPDHWNGGFGVVPCVLWVSFDSYHSRPPSAALSSPLGLALAGDHGLWRARLHTCKYIPRVTFYTSDNFEAVKVKGRKSRIFQVFPMI